MLDAGYSVLPAPQVADDPLNFRDTKRYKDRIKAARASNPRPDAFTAAYGAIDGVPAVVGVQDFTFMGGSMGMAVGDAFIAAAQKAIIERYKNEVN